MKDEIITIILTIILTLSLLLIGFGVGSLTQPIKTEVVEVEKTPEVYYQYKVILDGKTLPHCGLVVAGTPCAYTEAIYPDGLPE